jgi:hypothetical protein
MKREDGGIRSASEIGEQTEWRRVIVRRTRKRRLEPWEIEHRPTVNVDHDDEVGGITDFAIVAILIFAAVCVWPLLAIVGMPTSHPDDPVTRAEERDQYKQRGIRTLRPREALFEPTDVSVKEPWVRYY